MRRIRNTLLAAALMAGVVLVMPALAQGTFVASVVDLEITPESREKFLAALKENGAATINEPGCRRYDILQSPSNPNQILIYEVYENEAAVQAHRTTEHFKKYLATTKDMVVKRQSRPMMVVAGYSK